ncbi:MAG: lamin tail domain-containing protein [Saprospiraceae bacterium]|jgi:plastocyanin|nr:lamin tail domain-containing protein [Saprospiraceae bacterium]
MNRLFSFIAAYFLTAFGLWGQLVITEISYNPPESGTDSLEYIEFLNAGNQPVQLKGYRFSLGVDHTFTDTVIAPGKYYLLTGNSNAFKNTYGKMTQQWTAGALNNSGEPIAVVDSTGNPVIAVDLKDKAPWPTFDDGTDGNGKSIELCNPLADPNTGENWKVSVNDLGFQINAKQIFGTPGTANTIPPCLAQPDVIVEVSSNMFTPRDITISVGETVRWVNLGGTHNINGAVGTFPSNPASFGFSPPSADAWQYDFTFSIEGVYQYQCDPHASAGMKGTVTVQGTVVNEPYPLRSIEEVTSTNADGVADSLNVSCSLRGIVHGVNLRPTGLQFSILDGDNNGIGVFSNSSNFGYTVKEGDLIEVKGTVTQFNGFTQMTVNAVSLLSSGNSPVTPKMVSSFQELDESSLIRISNLTFTDPTQWTGSGSGFNLTMTDGVSTFTVRIDNDVDAYSLTFPGNGSWAVTGLLGQFDNASPYSEGYQLLPRGIADFSPVGNTTNEITHSLVWGPNPVTETIRLLDGKVAEVVKVYNQAGQLLLLRSNVSELDLRNLPSGWYQIHSTTEKKVNISRILKAN